MASIGVGTIFFLFGIFFQLAFRLVTSPGGVLRWALSFTL